MKKLIITILISAAILMAGGAMAQTPSAKDSTKTECKKECKKKCEAKKAEKKCCKGDNKNTSCKKK